MTPMQTTPPRATRRALIAGTWGASALLLAACAPKPAPPTVLPAVFVSTVRNDHGATERVLFGSLRPRVEAQLSFRTGGKVTLRAVDVGQPVRAGQVLGRLDAADYGLAVQAADEQQRAAEVDAVQAASDAARFQRLLADGSVGAADAERQQARADAAAARLAGARRQADLARNRAGYAVLTAPFGGVVTALHFETGQLVDDRQPALSLARPGELELQADLPETLVTDLGDWQARMRWQMGGVTRELPLRLREVAPSATAPSRTYRARYALGALPPGAELRMGMSAELRLSRPGRMPGAELPLSALLVTGAPADGAEAASAAASVWRVDPKSGSLQRTPVKLLSQATDQVRVAGLPDGALVVTVGAHKLDAGLKVRPLPRPLPAAAGTVASR